MWNEFWTWVSTHYVYQSVVLLFIVLYLLFKVFDVTKFHIGKDGVSFERSKRQKIDIGAEIIVRLGKVEERLDKIDVKLDETYGLACDAVVQSGIGVGWSDKGAPYDETVRALLINLSLGENGNHEERLIDVIMGKKEEGIKDYLSKLNDFKKENKQRKRELDAHFYDAIGRVNKRLGISV